MRLVVFTARYPCGIGEDFLIDEMHSAEKMFDEIIIVSGIKEKPVITKYVPSNAQVVYIRTQKGLLSRLFGAVACGLSISFWREVYSGCKERGFKKAVSVFIKTFLACDYIRHLKNCEKQWQFDDENTIYYSYWLDAAATYLAKNKARLNSMCVSRAHGGDCFYNREHIPFRKEQLQGLDAIFPISDAGKADILEHYANVVPNLKNKIFVSKLGIDIPQNRQIVKKSENQRVIVTCSNVIPLKRLDLMIEALSLCNDLNIKWIHFGDGSEMENIVSLAENKLSSKPNISFEFKGRVPNQEVLSFYDETKVDLFVNCSDSEGIPVSVMEAMAREIPAIARNVGANAELVNNNCGVLLPQNISSADLLVAIRNVLSLNEKEYSFLQKNAVEKVFVDFNAKQNHIKFYKQIIEMGLVNGKSKQ